MNKLIKTLAAFALIALVTPGVKAQAATLLGDFLSEKEIEVGVDASIDVYDKYMWRGFLLDSDYVMQPAITISVAGFEGGFWGSWDLESKDGLASDEVDGWLGYSFDLGFLNDTMGESGIDFSKVGLSFGNTWYAFPESDTYTEELYLGASLDMILSPYITWYHDYGDEENGGADGDFLMFGIGHSFTLEEEYGITLDLGGEIGLNNEAFINGEGGYYLATVGLTVPLADGLTFAPMMGYSVPFGDLEDSSDGNQPDEFYGGFSLAASF